MQLGYMSAAGPSGLRISPSVRFDDEYQQAGYSACSGIHLLVHMSTRGFVGLIEYSWPSSLYLGKNLCDFALAPCACSCAVLCARVQDTCSCP